MTVDPRAPVIVGAGQVIDRGDDAPEPVVLLADAVRAAFDDSGSPSLLTTVESIRVVRMLSWRYRDPGRLVGGLLGVRPRHTQYTTDGGQTPGLLFGQAGADLQAGRADTIVVGGTESWRTRMAFKKRGERPAWTVQDDDVAPTELSGEDL